MKWSFMNKPGDGRPKYLVVNADEGMFVFPLRIRMSTTLFMLLQVNRALARIVRSCVTIHTSLSRVA